MTNTCQNCGIITVYKYCRYCAKWLTLVDDHRFQLRKARKKPAGPNRNQQVRYHEKAIEDYIYLLGLRKNPKKGLTAKEYRLAEVISKWKNYYK